MTDMRKEGLGSVHFKDEYGRPIGLHGRLIVHFGKTSQYVYIKTDDKEYLLPFNQIIYIEWDKE